MEMTDNEQAKFILEMKNFAKETAKSPEASKEFLIKTGIYNKDRSLKEEYKK